MVSIFSFVFWPFGLVPLKKLFTSVAHFFIGSLVFGGVWFFELPIYSGYQSFV
jgi:hypothetical protein